MMALDLVNVGMIVVSIVITVLLLLVGHWFRWDLGLGKDLPRIPAYIYGLLSILCPVSLILIIWQLWVVLLLLWGSAICGGLAVMVAYFIDDHFILQKGEKVSRVERRILDGEAFKERVKSWRSLRG